MYLTISPSQSQHQLRPRPTHPTCLSRTPSSFCVPQVSQHAGQLTTALPSEPTCYWPLNLPCGAGWWWSASNSCVASCHCPAARTACTANSPFHLRQALASIQAVSRMSLFPRCPVPSRAGCWLKCQLRKYRDSALPACLAYMLQTPSPAAV